MQLSFKIISSPGIVDDKICDFIVANDNDFYPTIASRRNISEFVQLVYAHKGKFIICYNGNNIVGLSSVYLNHPTFIAYYLYIAIDKEFRGNHISTTLLNYIHELCRAEGVQRAMIKTWSTNLVSQAMFKKHGFFHIDTIEDDRSIGVHTYFYAKSFSEEWFRKPVTHIGILGSNDNYALGNFVKTISSIPKTKAQGEQQLPYTVVSAPHAPGATGYARQLTDAIACFEQNEVSHLVIVNAGYAPEINIREIPTSIEILDVAAITKKMVIARKKNCLLISKDVMKSMAFFDIDGLLQIPGGQNQKRVNEIIDEIRRGIVSPAYHKNEIAAMALLNDCQGVLLGAPELHTMFSFDKAFDEVEIFDPWMELAAIIQNNRIGPNNEGTIK